MGGVIAIPHYEPWYAPNWAYWMVLERLQERLDDPADVERVERAKDFQHLDFKRMPEPPAHRIARALSVVCDELRAELLATSDDPRLMSLAHHLPVLEMRLHDIFEE